MSEVEREKDPKKRRKVTKTGTVGDVITMSDKKKYQIQEDGSWKIIK